MSQPSNAAKAAAMLHHTWGLGSFEQALEVYNILGTKPELDIVDFLTEINAGIWAELDQLPITEWWENVEALALSIDAAHEWAGETT